MIRTAQQNKALHKYCELVAEALDEAGYDMKEIIKIPIRPNKENVKESMFKPIMSAIFPDKESTTELSSVEVTEVYEHMNRALGERFGIHVDWPSY
jgi:hypothetical protein